jgi:hypothetical protein
LLFESGLVDSITIYLLLANEPSADDAKRCFIEPIAEFSHFNPAVLIDTELNAAKKLDRSSTGRIFQGCNVSFEATGVGNNWAAGYHQRCPELGQIVLETIRKVAERTDHLDSFFVLNSLGGGTGSVRICWSTFRTSARSCRR